MARTTDGYSLGLDSSTQSLSAVLLDIDAQKVLLEHSLDYARDERLNGFGIHRTEYLVPPREEGEADQPPEMYLASLDALFEDFKREGVNLGAVSVINVSGQQHGHLYLSGRAKELFAGLREAGPDSGDLVARLRGAFSYGTAPIWRTSNTGDQAEALRHGAGGKDSMIELSGSDSPLRFTGAVVRRVGQQFPRAYRDTAIVQLISSFVPGVLAGDAEVPIDFGNGSGTSLMDYRSRTWSERLVAAAAEGLPGGAAALRAKLPGIAAPDSIVGSVARYFVDRYGLSPDCRISAGSGDNPQTKVLVEGDLLSLGTSFVFMIASTGGSDPAGYANSMYDGIGRPFMFGCRTNGAMTWDRVRALHGLGKKDYDRAEAALAGAAPGSTLFFWQPERESFPVSEPFGARRIGYEEPTLGRDYPGAVESSLAAVYDTSLTFAARSADPLYVTGGATASPEILRRVAALWNRPVAAIGRVGAALGTAVAGVNAIDRELRGPSRVDALRHALLPPSTPILPKPEDVAALHGDGGYLARFRTEYRKLIAT